MKKILVCLLFILGITNTVFATDMHDYHITCNIPEVKDIKISGFTKAFVVYMNNNIVMNQTVDVTYDSPVSGNLLFKCRLINSINKNEVPINITKFVNQGLNEIKNFHSIPAYIFNAQYANWDTFFDILAIDSVMLIN